MIFRTLSGFGAFRPGTSPALLCEMAERVALGEDKWSAFYMQLRTAHGLSASLNLSLLLSYLSLLRAHYGGDIPPLVIELLRRSGIGIDNDD